MATDEDDAMIESPLDSFYSRDSRPLAAVLGTNEIASAVAVHLHRAGWSVVMCHDAYPPVIRRAMSFHDALFYDHAAVDGIEGERAETAIEMIAALSRPDRVAVTPLHLTDILAIRALDVLVDARMQKDRITPDYRGLARVTVGLGPNFSIGVNCDVAVETRPARNGTIVHTGMTDAADGVASRLGNAGRERFVYAPSAGLWHTPVDIGVRLFKGFVVGHLGGQPVEAPIDGILRGVVRDGLQVPGGVKLLEIDPRGRKACWSGMDERGRTIAESTIRAIRIKVAQPVRMSAVIYPFPS